MSERQHGEPSVVAAPSVSRRPIAVGDVVYCADFYDDQREECWVNGLTVQEIFEDLPERLRADFPRQLRAVCFGGPTPEDRSAGGSEGYQERYSTEEEAVVGHAAAVKYARENLMTIYANPWKVNASIKSCILAHAGAHGVCRDHRCGDCRASVADVKDGDWVLTVTLTSSRTVRAHGSFDKLLVIYLDITKGLLAGDLFVGANGRGTSFTVRAALVESVDLQGG